jgi:hypothetical protein
MKILTAAFLAVLLLCAPASAQEHGDPAHFWISANPNYKRVGGNVHCCGKEHCDVIPQDDLEAILDKDGLITAWRVRGEGQIFTVGQPHALYDSIDTQHWGCKAPHGYHCIFIRQVGG